MAWQSPIGPPPAQLPVPLACLGLFFAPYVRTPPSRRPHPPRRHRTRDRSLLHCDDALPKSRVARAASHAMRSRPPSVPPTTAFIASSRQPSVPPTTASRQIDDEAAGFFGMDNVGYYTGILTSNNPNDPGLDDLNFLFTQDTPTPFTGNVVSDELQDDVVESQAAEVVPGGRRAKKGASHRQKKFDIEEDKVICSAWLQVSKDPINGANQPRSNFWGRIRAFFDEHKDKKTAVSVRTENSIMHRWLTILREVNKFCSCYEKIEHRNASGATIQDMINAALETYIGANEENKPFTLMHCYHLLKDEDKWKSLRIELVQKHKKQKTTKESTPSNVQASNNGDVQEVAAPGSEERKRPKGQKQVKQGMRDDASLVVLEKMWEKKEARELERDKAREASLEVERAALEVEKAALELEKKRLSNEEKKN